MIISFLDDDIDKPYVSSSLYNGANPSLVNLPFNDHQTSLKDKKRRKRIKKKVKE
ncbi:hypothetical protein [Campylobacter jejuni]|uniref:hypothetical protein n=1 Tax=Campylobacter jejuni TaxID=197 RepID=UPI0021AFF4F4|nr:hypothetical protein [Campylobacter jejuni]